MRIIFFFLLFTVSSYAQNNNQKTAYQYYVNGDYDKAIAIYEELNSRQLSTNIYSTYFISLCNLDRFSEAEKLAKKFYTKYPTRLNYLVDIIISQIKQKNEKKSDNYLKKLFKKISGKNSQVVQIANRFQSFSMYQIALDIYKKPQAISGAIQYDLQIAQLYALLGKEELMIKHYFNFLLRNPNKKKVVFTSIQRFLNNNGIKNENNYLIVKKALLKTSKLHPDRADFNEMLIWFFMQNKQYKSALNHVVSLDRRSGNSLSSIYDIGETLLDLEKYPLSIQAFDYIISKGFKSNLYIDAHINKLYALTKSINENSEDIKSIDQKYSQIIDEVGVNRYSILLVSNYAHFKAFYLNDLISAIDILDDVMIMSTIDKLDLAECKIQYADIMLLSGNIWDALLFYSQVEKDFKEHPIGHKAKFKRAKIAYYQGDFTWAQAQLDVLKSSTSKLIANDAMDLSLLITDNYALDTIDIPMIQFAKADLKAFQKKSDIALLTYDSILVNFQGHDLSDEIYYRKANIYLLNNNFDMYIKMLEIIIDQFSYEILIDDALFDLATFYDEKLNNKEQAAKYYQELILNFKGSIFVAEARERFRILRGDNLITEK
jgi:tetratricopeptide (TPR) repeat protein